MKLHVCAAKLMLVLFAVEMDMEVDWDDLIDLPSNKCVTYGPIEVAGHFWEVKLFPSKCTRCIGSPTYCTDRSGPAHSRSWSVAFSIVWWFLCKRYFVSTAIAAEVCYCVKPGLSPS